MNFNLGWGRSVIDPKIISKYQAKREKANFRHEHLNLVREMGS